MSISDKDRRTIFAIARDLGLDDAARKDVQYSVTGKISTTDMTARDAGKLIAHLRRLQGGGRPRAPKRAGRVPKTLDREPLLQKIEALLADMRLPWEYAEGIAWRVSGGRGNTPQRQPGVKRMEWAKPKHLTAVIAALHVEQKKRKGEEAVHRELERIGGDLDWLDELIPSDWIGKWQRNTRLQTAILNMLECFLDE